MMSTIMFWLVPVGASFLTTRYWSARDEGDESRHLWFGLYLVAVLVMVAGVFATSAPEERLGRMAVFFVVLVGATALQERRHQRSRRPEPDRQELPDQNPPA